MKIGEMDLQRLKQWIAKQQYQQALAACANKHGLEWQLMHCLCLYHLGDITQAGSRLREQCEANTPDIAQLIPLCKSLRQASHFDALVDLASLCLERFPQDHRLLNYLGQAYFYLGEYDQAEHYYRKSYHLNNTASTQFNLAFSLLHLGQYKEGLALYDARIALYPEHYPLSHPTFRFPLWRGQDPANKSIIIDCEQGLGDTLQFSRYISKLASLGAKVDLLITGQRETLYDLLATVEGVRHLYTSQEGRIHISQGYDYQCPLISLMQYLDPDLEAGKTSDDSSLTKTSPYIVAPHAHYQRWHTLFAPYQKVKKVGILWDSQVLSSASLPDAVGNLKRSKSLDLETCAPLFSLPNSQFFSLKLEPTDQEKQQLAHYQIVDMSEQIDNFSDTAAIIHHLDLVISIDTSVLHLAGAMAKPGIGLLPQLCDWRWLGAKAKQWYPSIALIYRQANQSWGELIEQAIKTLQPHPVSPKPDYAQQIQQAVTKGDFRQAIVLQQAELAYLEQHQAPDTERVAAIKNLCHCYFANKDYDKAYDLLAQSEALMNDPPMVLWNMATLRYLQGRYQEACQRAELAYSQAPDFSGGYEIFARICGAVGNMSQAKALGEQAMLAKDQQALANGGEVYPLPESLPEFNPQTPKRNIIAFSLWGNDQRYLKGAIENAKCKNTYYPHWTLRFYIEEGTDKAVIDQLLAHGAEVVLRPKQRLPFEGLFWRFLVINDPGVDYFLIRDADSVFSPKEVAAVDAWLASKKCFHIMRDHYEQTDLIQAGLWGGVGRVLPSINELLPKFASPMPSKMVDQVFLNTFVWPSVKQSVCIHDSVYRVFGAQDFPKLDGQPDIALGRYDPDK